MSKIEPSKGTVPEIEDGLYTVICRKVEEITVEEDQFGNFEKVKLTLEVEGLEDDDGKPVTIDPRANRRWGEKATLFQWAQAFGLDPDPYEAFDPDEFLDQRAKALIYTPEGKWPRVEKFTPMPKNRGKAPEAVTVTVDTPLGDWWKETRRRGWERDDVLKLSDESYGAEPSEITPGERVALMDALPEKG